MPYGDAVKLVLGTARDWFAAALKAVLEPEGFEVLWATGREAVLQLVAAQEPDVVLLDAVLAGGETAALCRDLVAEVLDDDVPLLLYSSAAADEDLCLEAYEAGVWAIFEEPIRSRVLVAAIRRFLAVAGRRADRRLAMSTEVGAGEPLERPALERLLPVLEAAASREETPMSCVVLGPTRVGSGELLMRQRAMTADLCGRHLRLSDLYGWMDGSDVAILALGAGSSGAEVLVRRLNAAAAGRADVTEGTMVLSAGIVELEPRSASAGQETGGDPHSSLAMARRALQQARADGGGVRRWDDTA